MGMNDWLRKESDWLAGEDNALRELREERDRYRQALVDIVAWEPRGGDRWPYPTQAQIAFKAIATIGGKAT
jgi:hypothetical protein